MKYKVQRVVREESNEYGKAGDVEYHVVSVDTGECFEVCSRLWQAKRMVEAWNK